MLGILFGPVGIGLTVAAVVGKSVYDSFSEDEVDIDYSSAQEAQREAKEDNNEKVKKSISQYKTRQKKRLKEKYQVDIQFISSNKTVNSHGVFTSGLFRSQKDTIELVNQIDNNSINNLELEVDEINQLIEELEVLKYEAS